MPRFVLRHFVNSVVDGVEVQLLGLLRQLVLAGGRAVFGFYANFQVLLGGVADDLAQKFCELRGVLFGNYSDEDKPYLDQRLARLGEEWNIPVAACNDYGHGQYAAILPIGELAELDASQKTLIYPNL